MTDKATAKPAKLEPIIRRPPKAHGAIRLIVLGLILSLLSIIIYVAGQEWMGEPGLLAALGALAGIGVFFLFALSLGLLQLGSRRSTEKLYESLVDGMDSGVVVVDGEGRIIYANRAYGDLLDAREESEVVSVEALFSRRMDSADIVYRIANAVRAGETRVEEFRLSSGLKGGDEGARWFRTGDQGAFDDLGYLRLTGRLKEIINRGGEKISPLEVDDVLLDHPAIAQVVTFAIPHPKLGEEVGAAVVLREGRDATEREIRDFAAGRLADFKVPRRIVIVAEIPKGATGKMQRIGLAEKLGLAGPVEA